MKALLVAVALLQAAISTPAHAPDEVEVTGPPAPALWRVTRGAGELWILPAPAVLPRGLAWNRLRLEGVLRGARVLIMPSAYVLERTGPAPRLATTPLGARLPASVRERFAAAVTALGEEESRFDRLAPLDAAYRLRDDAWRAAGLDPDQPDAAVRDLARRAKVGAQPAATYRLAIEAASPVLSDRQSAGCVEAAVDEAAFAQAHAADAARAWALGDVRAWLAQSRQGGITRCLDVAPAFAALRRRNLDDVAGAARAALAAGGKSVLLTSPDLLLRPGGLLDRLKTMGAQVEAPGAERVRIKGAGSSP